MRFQNDLSRPLDGADNLNIRVSVPGHEGFLTWRQGLARVACPAKPTFEAAVRYLIALDLEAPIQSVLLVPDSPPGRTVMAVIRGEDEQPHSVRFSLDNDCFLNGAG